MSASISPGRPCRNQQRREYGQYYTPAPVVEYMLAGCLPPLLSPAAASSSAPLRILDPACGNGAFLLPVYDRLCDWYVQALSSNSAERRRHLQRSSGGWCLTRRGRLRVVRDHLFGVDVDEAAVRRLRDRLYRRIAPDPDADRQTRAVLRANFRIGNALTGPGFEPGAPGQPESPAPSLPSSLPLETPIDWRAAFPIVARGGGFHLILGNPPYRREKDAKPLFDLIARSPLGRTWRQPRMDLWFYFLHRGIDLLQPGGRLAFIVNGYWTASSGAAKLIERLRNEVTFEEFTLLGDTRIFKDVTGRHLIFRLRNEVADEATRVVELHDSPEFPDDLTAALPVQPSEGRGELLPGRSVACSVVRGANTYQIVRHELFEQGRLSLGRPDIWFDWFRGLPQLNSMFDVRQGMAENPPRITRRLQREFTEFRAGQGVFVLSRDEVRALGLSPAERSLLRPYDPTSGIGRYRLPARASHRVLYLTRRTLPSLSGTPAIRAHLEPFRPILERRRETRRGLVSWWQLHWPRQEALFTEPGVLSVQMGRRGQFVYAHRPTFVGFSVNVVRPRCAGAMSLVALTGILNSRLAERWFQRYAKPRGARLEINVGVLERFPLPAAGSVKLEEQLCRLVLKRQDAESRLPAKGSTDRVSGSTEIHRFEAEIDEIVDRMYGAPSTG